MERVDSALTNESPFGSNLTTPVDEDTQLFLQVQKRSPDDIHISGEISESGSAIYLLPERDEDGFSTAVTRSLSKAIRESQQFSTSVEDKVCYRWSFVPSKAVKLIDGFAFIFASLGVEPGNTLAGDTFSHFGHA